jgi:NTE family protein
MGQGTDTIVGNAGTNMMNPLKYFRNRKVGLALGSGGAKGLTHIAVIEYLETLGIPIHMIAGSSIGAVVGALYCTGSMQKFKADVLKFSLREMLSFIDPVMPRSGLIEGKGFVKFMERYLSPKMKIEDLKVPLAIMATDYVSGAPVVFRSGSILEALRASISIPGVLVPVGYRGTLLVDGGVANPLPVNVVRGMGAGLTVAVNLHPCLKKRGLKHFVQTSAEAASLQMDSREIEIIKDGPALDIPVRGGGIRWLKSIENWLAPDTGKDKKKLPNIFDVITQSVDIMEYVNTELMLKYNSPTVLIEPDVTYVGTLDFADAARIINEGHLACVRERRALIRKIRAWI